MLKDVKEVYLRVDDDSNWYLIPEIIVGVFDEELDFISNIDYDDSPDVFDEFDTKFLKYKIEGELFDKIFYVDKY